MQYSGKRGSGLGNINQSPEFIGGDDYGLQSDSPCINSGNPDTTGLYLPYFDLAENPRLSMDTIDMGAYEYFGGIELNLKAFLEGPFNGTTMNTGLANSNTLPFQQPYNSSPWNYSGTEEVISEMPENTVDWLLLQVRDTTNVSLANEESIKQQQAVFILDNGSVVDVFRIQSEVRESD
ncbi:MAG: choice-of-anchor Q domain-containing protein [Bacteroidales bacterium]